MWEHVCNPLMIQAKASSLFRVLKERSLAPMYTFTDVWSKSQGRKCLKSHHRFQNTKVSAEAEGAGALK